MANVGRLAATLSLNSGAFNKGLKESGSMTRRFVSSLSGMKAGLAGLAAGLSVTAIGAFVKSSANQIEATGQLADELGMTTEELISFQHGADLAGISSEETSGALRKFVRNLDKLGVSGVTTGEGLKVAADEIAGIKDPTARAQRVVELFGKSGQKLIAVLSGGSAALEGYNAEAKKLGILFTGGEAAQVGAMNDAIDNVGKTVTGVAQRLAIQLAPTVETLAKRFVDSSDVAVKANKITSDSFMSVRGAIIYLAGSLDVLETVYSKFQKGIHKTVGWILQDMLTQFPDAQKTFADQFDRDHKKLTAEWDAEFLKKSHQDKAKLFFEDVDKRAKELNETLKSTPVHVAKIADALGKKPVEAAIPKAAGKGPAAVVRGVPFDFAAPKMRGSAEALEAISRVALKGRAGAVSSDAKFLAEKLKRLKHTIEGIGKDEDDDRVVQVP